MKFATSIHCMDGRIQEPIIQYLKNNYKVIYVDTITEPGPCKIIADNSDKATINSIIKRTNISVNKHHSKLIAISSHYDCAGNPSSKKRKKTQIKASVEFIKKSYPQIEVIGLWINNQWKVNQYL
ncbi:MAG: carbonic anhydrase [Candidatus Omnitrophota bacterium]